MPEPKLEQPTDAVIRLTDSAICGTDQHFVRGTVAGMRAAPFPIASARLMDAGRVFAIDNCPDEQEPENPDGQL